MAEYRTITVRAVLSDAVIKAGVTLSDMTIAVTPALSAPIKVTDLPPYTGATVVTPTEQVQTLETAGTAMPADVTVEAIPGEYADVSVTTATAEDVLSGKVFVDSSGQMQVGVSRGATAVAVVDTEDPAGGTVRSITAIDLTGDTVSPDTLLKGVIAHDAHGNRIVGVYEP